MIVTESKYKRFTANRNNGPIFQMFGSPILTHWRSQTRLHSPLTKGMKQQNLLHEYFPSSLTYAYTKGL